MGENTKDNKVLILIESDNGQWKAFDGETPVENGEAALIDVAKVGNLMKLTVEVAGRETKVVRSENRYNLYANNRYDYTYVTNFNKIRKEAQFKPVIMKDGRVFVAPNSLRTLCNYRCYTGSSVTKSAYGILGYETIHAISVFEAISERPMISSVTDINGEPLEKRTTEQNYGGAWISDSEKAAYNALKQPESFTMFNGRRIKKINEFKVPDSSIYWASDKDFIILEKEGLRGYVENGCGIVLINANIFFNTSGSYRTPSMKLVMENNGWKIVLYEGLEYTKAEKMLGKHDYSEVKHDILKLFCYKISSEPEILYRCITSNEESSSSAPVGWSKAGDCEYNFNKDGKSGVYGIRGRGAQIGTN